MRSLSICMMLALLAITMQRSSACLAAEKATSITGVVLDPYGKPLAGVHIDAVILSRRPMNHPLAGSTIATVVGQCESESNGSFTLKTRPINAASDIALEIFAYAEGFGICFQYLEDGREEHAVTLKLPEETVITGKLTNPNGDALANATLTFASLRSTTEGSGNSYPFFNPPSGFSAWPRPITTVIDGSFTVRGASSATEFTLSINDERTARERWNVLVGTETQPSVRLKTNPPRRVQGVVVAAGSNDPIVGATVRIASSDEHGDFLGNDFVQTDDDGRFHLTCFNGSQLNIRVTALGTKYEKLNRNIEWVEGTTIQGMTLPLDHDGFQRLDGTTADGQPASTIETEVPLVKVTFVRPLETLAAELTGTILVTGAITVEGSDTPVRGLFAVDVTSGRWWKIAVDVARFRVSPNGKYIALNTEANQLHVIAIDPNAPAVEISNEIRDGGFEVNCWTPNSDSLILSKDAPKRKHYYGEEYWQLDTDKWQLNIETTASKQLAVPSRYDVWDVSPDGQLFALQWDTHAHPTGAQLYFANRDGSRLRPLAKRREQYYWYPRFSPDGKSVLAKYLNAQRGGSVPEGHHISIRVIAINGSSERSIQVSDAYMPEIACWSPGGDQIAVVAYPNAAFSGGSKQSKIFVVDADGIQVAEVQLGNATKVFIGDIEWSAVILQPK